MISNGRGVLFNQGDDPFAHSQQEMVMNSVFRWLDNQQTRGGFESRFDLNKECDLPDTRTITTRDYREMYDRNPIAGRVVEVMPEECWKSFPVVYEDDDPEVETEFEVVLSEIRKTLRGEDSWYSGDDGDPLWSVCHRADVESGVGHFGIILIGIDDGKNLSDPVDGFEDKVNEGSTTFVNNVESGSISTSTRSANGKSPKRHKLLFLSIYGEDSISAVTYEADKRSPRYRKPKMYSINLGEGDVGVASTRGGGAENVHWSRVIHIPSQPVGSDVIGVPMQRPVWNNLLGLHRIYAIDPVSLWQNVVKTRWLSTMPQLGGDVTVDETSLKEMLWNIRNGLQRDGILKGMTATTEPISLADPGPHINVQIEAICIKLPMPKRIFMGSERGELSSGQDSDQWDDVVRGKRSKRCIPYIVVPLHDRLIKMGVLPAPKSKEGYKIDWEDPSEMSPMEKADLAAKRTDALAKYVGGQVSTVIDPLDFLSRILGMEEEEAIEILERAQESNAEAEAEKENSAQAELEALKVSMVGGLGAKPEAPGQQEGDADEGDVPAKKSKPENEEDDEESLTDNSFCPTGKGGGIDPTCSPSKIRDYKALTRTAAKNEGFQVADSSDPGMSEKLQSEEKRVFDLMGEMEDKGNDSGHEYEALFMMSRVLYTHNNLKLSERANTRTSLVLKDEEVVAGGLMTWDPKKKEAYIKYVGSTERGAGKYVMASLLQKAKDKGIITIKADASDEAVSYNRKFGFDVDGPKNENGVPMSLLALNQLIINEIVSSLLELSAEDNGDV